jgi:hypothetical protein
LLIAIAALVAYRQARIFLLENCQAATRSCLNRAVNVIGKTTGNPHV